MYKLLKTIDLNGDEIENIFISNQDGSVTTFQNIESNDGNERKAYLAWVAEGGVPTPADEVTQ
jgi:hypothetical protein